MISFRYHVVSTIAVFLGIVLGVVVGTTAVNGAVVGDLRRQVSDLKSDKDKAADTNRTLSAQVNNANILAATYGHTLSANKLAQTPVVVVSAPGATAAMAGSVVSQIQAAGGTVSARVTITRDLVDPRRSSDVRSLVTSGVHPIGLTLPTTDDAGRLVGSLLGYVLLGKGQATDLTQAVTGLTQLNMVRTTGPVAAGKLVVIVTPGKVSGDPLLQQNLLGIISQIAATGPALVAGDSSAAASGGVIAALRSGDASRSVSTVDNADTALGQLTFVLAAAEAAAGKHGHYGTGADTDGLLPGAAQ